MRKKMLVLMVIGGIIAGTLAGCGQKEGNQQAEDTLAITGEGVEVDYVYSNATIDLAPYKGLSAKSYTDNVTEERVDEYITYILNYTYGNDEEGNPVYTTENLDETIVAEISGEEMSVSDYRESIKNLLREEDKKYYDEQTKVNLFQQVTGLSSLKEYKDEDLEPYIEYLDSFYQEYAKNVNATFEDFKKDSLGYETEEEYQAALKEEAEYNLKTEIVIETIAEQEGLKVTEEDKAALIADFIEMGYGQDEETIMQQMTEEEIETNALYYMVIDFIIQNADIK